MAEEEYLEEWAKEKIRKIFPWHPGTIHNLNKAVLRNFLDGEWVLAKKSKSVINSLNGEHFIWRPDTSEDELTRFIELLKRCPSYGLHNPLRNVERYVMYGKICAKAAKFLRTQTGREYFAKLIQIVMPKDIAQCYGEVDVTAAFLENFSGDQVRFLAKGQTSPGDRLGQEPTDYRWPYGPVAIVFPFNFPLEIPALQLMGALFMGNKAIIKADSRVGIVVEAFTRLLLDCGMPPDDMLLIHCRGKVMEKIVTNPVIRLTQFTGSSAVASRLLKLTGGRVKKEDSGFDWKLLGPNSIPRMIDSVAEQCDKDAYAASGQKCSALSILFIHNSWGGLGFALQKLKPLAQKRNLQDLTVGPVLTWTNQQIQEHLAQLLKIENSILLFGGKPISQKHNIPECYGSWQPTAVFVPLRQILCNFDLVTKEVFAPFQVITIWETKKELDVILDIFEKMGSRLTAAIVDNDPGFLNYVLSRTTNGTIYAGIKARTTGAPENHFFGPCSGHPADAGIGTPEAIKDVWSQNRTIIKDTNSGEY
jgi:1-pyrroline-5-carboxylate dehydrogenase